MKQRVERLLAAGLGLMACSASAGEFVARQGASIIEGSYIVAFEDEDSRIAEMVSQRLIEESVAKGFKVDRTWKNAIFGAAVSGLDDEGAKRIAQLPGVKFVENDVYLALDAVQINPPSWGIDRIDQRSLPLSASYTYDYQATSVRIYILDTGIETGNSEFNSAFGMGGGTISRATNVFDAYTGTPCTATTDHGTMVAGVAGSKSYGVAKNVQLNGVKVTDCTGTVHLSYLLAGLDWVVTNGVQPAVINMSIHWDEFDHTTSLLDDAIVNAYFAGYFLVKSAGNNATDACLYQPTAAMSTALYTVAGSTSTDSFWTGTWGSGSGYGPCVDIIAPAWDVSTVVGTSTLPISFSGNSASTPHVAGAAALILDQYPSYSPSQIAVRLNARATTGAISSVPSGTINSLLYTGP